VLGAIILLAGMDWRIALPMVLWLIAYVFYVRHVARKVANASERMSATRSMVTGRVVDAYTNVESVKLFADAKREESYAKAAMRRHRVRFMRFLRLMTSLSFGLAAMNGVLMVAVIGPAIYLWTQGNVTIGATAAAAALVIRLNGMTGWIMWVTIRIFEHLGTLHESLESVSVPHGVVDADAAPALVVRKGEIAFKGLSHHYGKEKGGLDNINLVIKPGEKVGLVGRSGAGKSSLVNLLLRFRDVEQGEILIDGQNVALVRQDSLRGQIGVVTQDSSLLHRSVRANILYGRPDASEDMMIRAAKRAEAHGFIQGLRDPKGRTGYDAYVGERGVKLSGGQRQRVAIARVILKDAPILVLDEATSALDSEVEAAIQSTLFGVMEGKTVIAIAHRLSTIAQMDRIIVLDDGRVAEEGTHAALLAQNGLYAGFWNRQSGGFIGLKTEAAE
jgi:ATP-binding cassette subfamily B multidrug efflux pump